MAGTFEESSSARSQYIILCIGTFLCFTTASTLTVLSVILNTRNFSTAEIGLVLSSPTVPVLVALLVSGALTNRFGSLKVMLAGQVLTIVPFVLLQWGISSFEGAWLLRALIGIGFGLYFTASMVYTRRLLQGSPNLLYYFGIFSSMFPLPNAIGPFVAEQYLKYFGLGNFFHVLSIPCIVGIGLLVKMRSNKEMAYVDAPIRAQNEGSLGKYKRILSDRKFLTPSFGIVVVGLIWGFAIAYMALYLKPFNIAVAYFFTPVTMLLLLSRFGLIRYLQYLSTATLAFMAFGLLAASYLSIALFPGVATTVVSGLAFGLGYSLGFPLLNVWSTGELKESDRPVGLALFNCFFQGGIFSAPLLVAAAGSLDLKIHMLILASLGAIASIAFFAVGKKAQP